MYYTLGNCFRAIRTIPGRHLAPGSVSSSGDVSGTKNFNFAVVKIFSGIYQPRPISKCKLVLDIYFRAFSSILEVMFSWKMAICEYPILAIFGQFWIFRAKFGPGTSKEYFVQLFRCKKNNRITKSWSIWLFQKLVPQSTPKTTPGPKTHLKGPRRAKIGTNASHTVQLTSLGPKKPDSNPTPQRSVPLTWNQPVLTLIPGQSKGHLPPQS